MNPLQNIVSIPSANFKDDKHSLGKHKNKKPVLLLFFFQVERVYLLKKLWNSEPTTHCWKLLCQRNFNTTKLKKRHLNLLMIRSDRPFLVVLRGRCWRFTPGHQLLPSSSGTGVSLKGLSRGMHPLERWWNFMASRLLRCVVVWKNLLYKKHAVKTHKTQIVFQLEMVNEVGLTCCPSDELNQSNTYENISESFSLQGLRSACTAIVVWQFITNESKVDAATGKQ